jgi:hypothetical protein
VGTGRRAVHTSAAPELARRVLRRAKSLLIESLVLFELRQA